MSVVIAHGAGRDMDDPAIENLHRELTERHYLTLRFNQPFAEAKKRNPDSIQVLRRTLRSAVAILAADPTAAPAHLFLGGKGLGAQVAADLAGSRIRVDGVFFLGYPLHASKQPEAVQAEQLYRIISPILFVQGTRDRFCDIDVLRQTLTRVGAPTMLQVCREADQHFKVLKKSNRVDEDVRAEILNAVDSWITKILE